MRLLGFGTAVVEAVERASPHRLTTYVYDVAQAFTAFYEHCPVLKAADASTRASRLALSDVTARVLARGLQLLGIDAPDQM
jgi:arginyl-tRNA synthetase